MAILTAGETVLPAPVQLSVGNEIIWSSNTGRGANGIMVGDVVAEKHKLKVTWGILTASELALIKSKLATGFILITFQDCGASITISAYRGTLEKEYLGCFAGVEYYKSASVEIVEQ
ncbi:MAG: hypothetical protein ACI4C1_08670 [Lachnospiraceae bacterium]